MEIPVDADQSKFQFIKIDLFNSENLQAACMGVDVVIHAAGLGAKDCELDPVLAMQVNGIASGILCRAAIYAKVPKFFYISTAHVYKSPLIGRIDERTLTSNTHPYATSHVLAENLIELMMKNTGVDAVIFRLSNGFGYPVFDRRSCWTLVVNDFCRQAIEKKRIIIKTDANQFRDFIGIRDVCKVLEVFVNQPISEINRVQIINLGSGEARTLRDLANLVAQETKNLFGFYPEVILKSCDEIFRKGTALEYTSSILGEAKIQVDKNIEPEIIDLLKYCSQKFLSKGVG